MVRKLAVNWQRRQSDRSFLLVFLESAATWTRFASTTRTVMESRLDLLMLLPKATSKTRPSAGTGLAGAGVCAMGEEAACPDGPSPPPSGKGAGVISMAVAVLVADMLQDELRDHYRGMMRRIVW